MSNQLNIEMVDGFQFHMFNQTSHGMNDLSYSSKNPLPGPTSRPHRKEFGPEDIHMLRNIKAQKAIEFTLFALVSWPWCSQKLGFYFSSNSPGHELSRQSVESPRPPTPIHWPMPPPAPALKNKSLFDDIKT